MRVARTRHFTDRRRIHRLRVHRRRVHRRRRVALLSLLGLVVASASPAAAAAAGPARHRAAAAATAALSGQVRDGSALYRRAGDTPVVVPQGLPTVAHATVTIPQLSLSVRTNAGGSFAFRLPAAAARRPVSVRVTAAGLGSWQESGIRLVPGDPASLYVQLDRRPQVLAAPRPGPQRANGPVLPQAYQDCGHNSSGWTSQQETPPAIRVYMTGTGNVVDYGFEFYTEHVLPNEWGSGAPQAALQAGAEAIRDYAWYFILNGSKGTAADVNPCSFDVDDTTAYQDFVPGAPAYASTNDAVTSTATTVFSHGGTITQTSYCSNFVTGCGADSPADTCGELANGTSMSQIGSDACADDGDSWQQILSTYYYSGYSTRNELAAYVFWTGTGSSADLWHAQGPADGSLGSPASLGMGPLGSPPAAGVDANGATYVYWRGQGPQYDLWEAYWNGSGWTGPVNRGMGPLGSAPTVAVTGSGTAYVFWKGQDGNLWEAQGPATGTLSGPYNRGMGPLGSAPAAGVDANGATYIYWEGTAPQDNLYEAYWNGSGWTGPVNRGMGPLGSAPAVAITGGAGVTGGGPTAYVFWKGQNGDLWQAQGPANGSLSGPTDRGMGTLGSAPAAGVDVNGYTYVYWEGSSPQDLFEAYWNGSAWTGPYNRGEGPLGSQPTVAIFS